MASNFEWPLPIKGYSEGVIVSDTPQVFSNSLKNVRPKDTIDGRLRLGQRPALAKVYTAQIASAISPVVAIGTITVVDYRGS